MSTAPPAKSLIERITQQLMGRIFFGTWRPGERLPSERDLAEELGVDRTSLRSALGQLQRMRVIDVVHGSGATAKDFTRHAGIEFLASIFAEEEALPRSYLVEAFDAWVAVMPWVVQSALARATTADFRRLGEIFDAQLASLDDPARLLDLEMEAQTLIVGFAGNVILSMLFTSTAPIRRRLVGTIIGAIDTTSHVRGHRELVDAVVSGRVPRTEVAALYQAHLGSFAAAVREKLYAPPAASPRASSATPRAASRPRRK